MRGADAGEHHVAGADDVGSSLQLGLDLAVEEEIGLLERMVMDLCRTARLVVDREHRQQLGAEDAIDEHLDADPAVHHERRVAPGGCPAACRIAECKGLGLGRRPVVVPDETQPRIAERWPDRSVGECVEVEGLAGEERVAPVGVGAEADGRVERQPARVLLAAIAERVPGPDRHEGIVAGRQPVGVPVDLDEELAAQDVQRLLERMEMPLEPAAAGKRSDRQLGVDGPLRRPDEHGARQAMPGGRVVHRLLGERPVDRGNVGGHPLLRSPSSRFQSH